MRKRDTGKPVEPPKVIRCAIYTRKSTEEGLEQEFNSLDAQRESGEAYIAAQKHEGWTCIPDKYDDGGWSGGNMERPALKRLLTDIEAGRVDCVVVYKVDRLSRSLMDFARIMQVFDANKVSFVSVTQAFNTTHSMGRLTLNILLSFAQFEREIISERTRDKIAAARRKGKWSGGKPLLGYDILSLPTGAKLVVNEDEAHRVRQIYELYLKHHALIPTLKEITSRGWTNKRWITRKGGDWGGKPFDKGTLYKLLTSPTYAGMVAYHDEVHPGEHTAIVDKAVWEKVQAVLSRNGNTGGAPVRNKYGALLKGLISCACCRCSMIPTYTSKGGAGGKRYRYYVCLQAQKQGWHSCPSKSVPAGQIEQFVVEQIRRIGKDPLLLEGTIRQVRQQQAKEQADLEAEQRGLERERKRHHTALQKLSGSPDATRLADVTEALGKAEQRMTAVRSDLMKSSRSTWTRRMWRRRWPRSTRCGGS
ncbi:MAG TPA: recombinase family protein [Tepidisphaeraceae bacterium]|nr:recombinase family protein [Tepidisphaeraceae bacterium]